MQQILAVSVIVYVNVITNSKYYRKSEPLEPGHATNCIVKLLNHRKLAVCLQRIGRLYPQTNPLISFQYTRYSLNVHRHRVLKY